MINEASYYHVIRLNLELSEYDKYFPFSVFLFVKLFQ